MNSSLAPMVVKDVTIACPDVELEGTLSIPAAPKGLVVFAHGSGSSRNSPRNRYVAEVLHSHHLATLLFDLLTDDEVELDNVSAELRFNIGFLAQRLIEVTRWTATQSALDGIPVGYFGSSTGAAAALVAAAELPHIGAVVSRGGRSDLADHVIVQVEAPTLFLAGGTDTPVIDWNRNSAQLMQAENHVHIIPGAGHLFTETGTLEQVAHHAAEWLEHHLAMSTADQGDTRNRFGRRE